MRYIQAFCVATLLCMTGCVRSSTETWEDLKTAGRYLGRSVDIMLGGDRESRMFASEDDFLGPNDSEFIPLKDSDIKAPIVINDTPIPQPKTAPGQKGIPALSDFYLAPDSLMSLLKPVHFDTDDHVVKDKLEVQGLLELANHMKKHSQMYLMVEGHADERASASYNMALGMRRANFIRSFLVKNGVDQNRIFTVSHGKEKPLVAGHSPEDWKKNRRSEFKIYQR